MKCTVKLDGDSGPGVEGAKQTGTGHKVEPKVPQYGLE